MRANRSMPSSTIIPVLRYPDVPQAVAWLSRSFGFTERLRIGGHRVQLDVGDGAVVATDDDAPGGTPSTTHSIMVRVADVDAHHAQAQGAGATIHSHPPLNRTASVNTRSLILADIYGRFPRLLMMWIPPTGAVN